MKSSYRINLKTVLVLIGVILVVLSVLLITVYQIIFYKSAQKNQMYVDIISKSIPPVCDEIAETRIENTMPSFEVDGEDFVAVIEFSVNGIRLPVGNSWNKKNYYPCRYSGSVYDSSLIVGSVNRRGQFDFVKEVSVGDTVYITDMTGGRYSYNVSNIEYEDHADNDILNLNGADLVIFVKNLYAFEYIIIYCVSF